MKMQSRKRLSKPNNAFVPPFAQPNKLPKPDSATATATATATASPSAKSHFQIQNDTNSSRKPAEAEVQKASPLDKMLSVLADAGCTLINPAGPPCIPSDLHKLRNHLNRLFSGDSSLRHEFLKGFAAYVASPSNFRRVLLPSHREGSRSVRSDTLVRVLLLVHSVQQDLLCLLLEKLPEYFDIYPCGGVSGPLSSCLNEDVARLILNQFRWLDFLVDSEAFTQKLLQVLSICPLPLKKEIIGSLPEIIGDQNNSTVISSLQQMLQDDSSIIVNVLDSFSNLKLDNLLREQVITIALSCIRTIDVEHMPYLLRFLLLSVEPSNSRRIISQIREQLKFLGACHKRTTQQTNLKGKSVIDNTEASILDALRSSLRFKNMLCQEIIKELKSLEEAQDHKVIDIWLLTLVYMNNEPLQKIIEKLLKKKIVEGCIQEDMFEQYINGIKDLSKDYLPTFLSISAYLLACKEQRAREFGIHMYICLFEGFVDSYSRQEVVGALIAHLGSGINCEVTASLETMVKLASKNSKELIPFYSHITGILDYMEGFNVESLHKVYEVFTLLALSTRSSSQPYECSIANELLMILRKQINNPDLMYKKMGLIGTLKVVSYLADANSSLPSLSQNSNYEEAMGLLKLSLDSCKQLPLSLIMFYEELVSTLKGRRLHPTITEWVSNHAGEFESIYLSDIDGQCLPVQDFYGGIEGELWMNLDGNMSPVCLNILPLVFPSFRSSSPLQVLPANFVLLSLVEKLTNRGSLGGIDALLGCPLHLPSSKLFSGPSWKSLTGKQKQLIIFSLYYAANWMRELINTFSTQVVEGCSCTSQATKEEIILKLLKRLRNLVFIESLLNNILEKHSVLLPELYPRLERSPVNGINYLCDLEKTIQRRKENGSFAQNETKSKKKSSSHSAHTDTVDELRQPTIIDIWRKAGANPSQENLDEDISVMPSKRRQTDSAEGESSNLSIIAQSIEVSTPAKFLEAQRNKFRPLSVDCFSILTFSENDRRSCCADSAAELPLHLYLLRHLHKKLGFSTPPRKQNIEHSEVSDCFSGLEVPEFLNKIRPLFPSLRRHLDCAVDILRKGPDTCQDHWKTQCNRSEIPEITDTIVSTSPALASISVFKETLQCFGKMLNLPDIQKEKSILSDLLQAFHPKEMASCFFHGMNMIPSPGNIDYLYSGAYAFLQGVFEVAITFSFILASEVVLALELMVTSFRIFLDKSLSGNEKDHVGASKELLPFLCSKLGSSAQRLLMHKFDRDDIDDNLKAKGELIQKMLHIYLENCRSTSDLIHELVRSVSPRVSLNGNAVEDDNNRFPTLCPATLVIWYRVMHEENLATLNNLVKQIAVLKNPRASIEVENIGRLLNNLLQSVNVLVSLVSMCKIYDKVSVHAMAVKYGGKFIDSFLKVFDFLQAQFQRHGELIIQLVKELQKATRTVQTLCSEGKGSKRMAIASKIPATKRSMERFLFHVKALLYTSSSGCTFWIGNLKHKNLMGDVVSSQAYVDEQHNDDVDEDPTENIAEDQPANVASD